MKPMALTICTVQSATGSTGVIPGAPFVNISDVRERDDSLLSEIA